MTDLLDQFGHDNLLETDLGKRELAEVLDVSPRTIESLTHSRILSGRRAKRKNLYRVAEVLQRLRTYERRARKQDRELNGLEREILKIAEIRDLFVDSRLYFSKRRLARKCNVSIRTIEEWTRRGLTPVAKVLDRRNVYPALAAMICLCRNRKITPQYLCLTLWIGEL